MLLRTSEFSDDEIDLMRRADTNGSGFVSALDALVVINQLNVMSVNQPNGTTDDDEEDADSLETDLNATANVALF